ncbi:MAG: hypothetical protein ACK5RG_04325 [Cyclobacteriaceae bacterium]|jgi:hypothetical protein
MAETYPFVPKTNLKIKVGQFWPIKLKNGNYACGIVLDIPLRESRDLKSIFIGLLNWTGKDKPSNQLLENSELCVIDQGKAHIKTISSCGESIEGEIEIGKTKIQISDQVTTSEYGLSSYVVRGFKILRKSNAIDHKNLTTRGTWGYSYINIIADRLLNI